VASPRRNPSSFGLTASRPILDGGSRGLITGALFKVARESAGLTQQDLADALAADKTTVQGWETGRRPLTSARAGNLVALRTELLDLGADPTLVDSLDTAAQADHILDRLLDSGPADVRHPLAVRVLPQPLSELLAWPLKDTPPRVVLGANRPARRGPVAGGPMLAADDRRRLVANLRRAAEDPPGPADKGSLIRRQVAYLASFDAPGTPPDGWPTSAAPSPTGRATGSRRVGPRPAPSPSPSTAKATPTHSPGSSRPAATTTPGRPPTSTTGPTGSARPAPSNATTPS
jgi:transcriptional regulator with XRE-family HTH domain